MVVVKIILFTDIEQNLNKNVFKYTSMFITVINKLINYVITKYFIHMSATI